MLYVETSVAAEIFNTNTKILINSASRNSTKYPFLRLQEAGTRSRGGVKLLFEVEIADISSLVRAKKLSSDVEIYMPDSSAQSKNGLKMMKFSEIKKVKVDNNDGNNQDEGDIYLEASEEELVEARRKRDIIKRYETSDLSSKKFCESESISEANLFRWQRAYKEQNLRGLLDRRGKKKGSHKLEEWMKDFILTKFRAYGAGDLNITQLWKELHFEYGKRTGKFSAPDFLQGKVTPLFDTGVISRFLKEYKAKNILDTIVSTKGIDKTISYLDPAHGTQGIFVTRRNQCWQIDSSKLDVIVRDGKGGVQVRPNILSIIDVFSGRCVATLAETSNALGITRLLWRAIELLGKPECIKGDNGKDYISKEFQDLLEGLGIDYDAARAYHGKDKAFVERHFGTIQRSKMAHTPGYIGGSVAKRENIEQQTPKKERHAKDEYGWLKKTNQKHLLTYDDMKKRFETAVLEWNITAVKRKKNSPIQRWNSDDTPLKTIEYERFLLFAGSKGIHKVGKKGITIDKITYASRMLPDVRTEVRVSVNIDNVSEAFIYTLDGEFICKATDSSLMELRADEFKIANRLFNDRLKAVRKGVNQAKLSEFTKLNVDYDLAQMQAAHQEALKKENRLVESSNIDSIKEAIAQQEVVSEITSAKFDYSKFEMTGEVKKNSKKSVLDMAIERASGE
ncbi:MULTISPECIES: DDE-type integrase/transposase/recombinase [Campylobacter]|uniref:DDE-type integrase/transposase/recombinase n=1 Tax=Campylobacter TaxID=194 RepID=UPI0019D2D17D|nr:MULTISPECIES: DDE-type integrase/transposase/recombinase [Campylobacter]MBN7287426.1 transposase [Campylobacter curvus]MDU6828121.1 DDE-type integrase/transposase/recombinase [Campylobacter sp.]